MKFVVEQAVLSKALARVGAVVERRTTIPILSNLKLEARQDSLTISATDMDIDATISVRAEVAKPGHATVPAATLDGIVRKLQAGAQIEMDHDAEAAILTVRAGRSKFSLPSLPVEDFPAFGSMPQAASKFTLSAEALASLIDTVRFAISTEETRYYLCGIYLHAAGAQLRTVATDGHRLARASISIPDGAAGMPGVIVPRKAVAEIRKLIDGTEGDVEINVSSTRMSIKVGPALLATKLIDGQYPDYERVIPVDNDKMLEVGSRELSATVERVSAISSERSSAVKLTFLPTEVTISASSPEYGSASDGLDRESFSWSGRNLEVGFNGRYLTEVIKTAACDRIRVALNDAASPAVFTDAAGTDDRLFVLMPMRV